MKSLPLSKKKPGKFTHVHMHRVQNFMHTIDKVTGQFDLANQLAADSENKNIVDTIWNDMKPTSFTYFCSINLIW